LLDNGVKEKGRFRGRKSDSCYTRSILVPITTLAFGFLLACSGYWVPIPMVGKHINAFRRTNEDHGDEDEA